MIDLHVWLMSTIEKWKAMLEVILHIIDCHGYLYDHGSYFLCNHCGLKLIKDIAATPSAQLKNAEMPTTKLNSPSALGDVIIMEKTIGQLEIELSDIKKKYEILREFLKEQEWTDGENLDECPWCGVPESHGIHNFPCYFDDTEKKTRIIG
jgi:hypothetical protein